MTAAQAPVTAQAPVQEVAVVVVEVAAQLDPTAARAVVAQWLADHPEVADAAEVVVVRPGDLAATCALLQERLPEAGPSALVCGDARGWTHAIDLPTRDVGLIDEVSTLVAVLDDVATSVDLMPYADVRPGDAPDDVNAGGSDIVPGRLLYVATLGRARRAPRGAPDWRAELLDLVARHTHDHLVRSLTLAEGIVDQSPLAVAGAPFPRAPRSVLRAWLRETERVDLRAALADLSALLDRDLAQAAFEGVRITGASCVLAVEAPVMGVNLLADDIAALAARLDLMWVLPHGSGPSGVPVPSALADAPVFRTHPELASEVARALGVAPRRLDAQLQGGVRPQEA